MTTYERIAMCMTLVGATLMAAAAQLKESARVNTIGPHVILAQEQLGLIENAIAAMTGGDERECLRILESFAV